MTTAAASTAPVSEGRQRQQRVRDRRYLGTLVGVFIVAALVAFAELDYQTERILTPTTGYSWPLSTLFGLDFAAALRGWDELIEQGVLSGPGSPYGRLLLAHVLVDVIFIACYTLAFRAVIVRGFRGRSARRAMTALLVLAVVADLVEDTIATAIVFGARPAPTVLVMISAIKAIAFAVTAAAIAVRLLVPYPSRAHRPRSPGLPRRPDGASGDACNRTGSAVRRYATAVLHHRFSFAMIAPLFVLSVLPGHPILEQLPDVQRSWLSADGGLRHAAAAFVALGCMALFVDRLGRVRTGFARRCLQRESPLPVAAAPENGPTGHRHEWSGALRRQLRRDVATCLRFGLDALTNRTRFRARAAHLRSKNYPVLSVWLVGPAVALSGALLVGLGFSSAPVQAVRLAIFCAVPLAIAASSWFLRRLWETRPDLERPDHQLGYARGQVSTIAFVGQLATLLVLALGGLGLIRSFTALAVLPQLRGGSARWELVLAFIAATLMLTAPTLLAWYRSNRLTAVDPIPGRFGDDLPTHFGFRRLTLACLLGLFFLLGLYPVWWSQALGVVAIATLSIASLVGIVAATGLLIQDRPVAEVFRLLGRRRTPLVTVLLLTFIAVGLGSDIGTINRVTSPAPPTQTPPDTRTDFDGLVGTWAGTTSGCEVNAGAGDSVRVRPMLMVAAEGGGIRAAYWTVRSLDALVERAGCSASSTLFSAGASGGSVGLTVARFSGTPDQPGTAAAVTAVTRMAGPETLGAAVIGTFVRDPWYGASGVPLPTYGPAATTAWQDRARLIERGWADASNAGGNGWGSRAFLTDSAATSPAPGVLIVNSASVLDKCRVWVSQARFASRSAVSESGGEQSCDSRLGPAARTIDLFTAYGPLSPPGPDCLGELPATTAALLTARFPYVTPGGAVGECPAAAGGGVPGPAYWPRTQLVDGGYLENTGIATITDLAENWSAQVRAHNAEALANGEALIVPIVVYLTNEQPNGSRPPERRRLQNEFLVPPLTIIGGAASQANTEAFLQRAETAVAPESLCPRGADGRPDSRCLAAAEAFERRVIVVDRAARPEVPAPLGWVMSESSIAALDETIEVQARMRCVAAPTGPAIPPEVKAGWEAQPICRKGFGSLGDLIGYLTDPQ